MGVAGTAAWHRLRKASPERMQRLGWRNWALPGAPPAHAASAPPPRRLSASAAVVEVLQMGRACLAAWHRLRVASPEMVQRLGWRNLGPAHGYTPAHQPLHRAGDAGGHDLKTTSWLRHTSSIHDPASAWNAPCPCKIMQRAGTAATARFWRD